MKYTQVIKSDTRITHHTTDVYQGILIDFTWVYKCGGSSGGSGSDSY